MPKLTNSLNRRPSVNDAEAGKTRRSGKTNSAKTRTRERESTRTTRTNNSVRKTRERNREAAAETNNKKRNRKSEGGECTIKMQRVKETKNKWLYHEVDDDTGDVVENPFRDGRIGQAYFTKELIGDKPKKEITITVNF